MKRLWLVLLCLGLIASLSTAAMAVDVQIGGEFYAAGMYMDKTSLQKNGGTSTAFYFQRLRLDANFVVSPGLCLLTRVDIMERQWGATRSAATSATYSTVTSTVTTVSAPAMYDSAGTRAENENIAFDHAYVQYTSPIGQFSAGAQNDYAWGTVFGDRSKPALKLTWAGGFGAAVVGLQIIKEVDNSASAVNVQTTPFTDGDANGYLGFVMYRLKFGNIGYLFRWNRNATSKPGYAGLTYQTLSHLPYWKLRFGPVSVEGELNYTHGNFDFNTTGPLAAFGNPSAKIDSWAAYINADADFGMAYVGGTFAFLDGQINPGEYSVGAAYGSPNTTRRTGLLTGGTDWNPCLILWNYERSYWAGGLSGHSNSVNNTDGNGANSNGMSNAYFFQLKAGVRPVEALDINLAVSYANAVVKPAGFQFNDYGWEIDATATYKITNNLSYMLGAGYLFTGKYFKGASDSNELQDDYLLINKLTLTF